MTITAAQFTQLELPPPVLPSVADADDPAQIIPTDLTAKLTPTVENTITRLKQTKFIVDPIAGPLISKIVSVMSSAYKRHGSILERAIFERLKENPRSKSGVTKCSVSLRWRMVWRVRA
jgi:hypothetical protein